jgi:hypothetical protein
MVSRTDRHLIRTSVLIKFTKGSARDGRRYRTAHPLRPSKAGNSRLSNTDHRVRLLFNSHMLALSLKGATVLLQSMASVPTPTTPGARMSAETQTVHGMSTGSKIRICCRRWPQMREYCGMGTSRGGSGIMQYVKRLPQSRIACCWP